MMRNKYSPKDNHLEYAFFKYPNMGPLLSLDLLQIFRIDGFTVLLKRYTIGKENEMLGPPPFPNPPPSLQNYC